MVAQDTLNVAKLSATVTMIFRQCNVWVKPVFGTLVFSIYVHVTRLTTVVGVKVDTIGACS